MHPAARSRLFLARRPWLYWAAVVALLGVVALSVHGRLLALDDARRSWGETRAVVVAVDDADAGEVPAVTVVHAPVALVPARAIAPDELMGPVRRAVGEGEIVVRADLASGSGPAALADDGQVVVAVDDPLVTSAEIGVGVAVYADGHTLTTGATVVGESDGALLVAVAGADAPLVSAAARLGTASLGFTG